MRFDVCLCVCREVGWESSQLEDLATEVLGLVEKTVGANEFTAAYNHVRSHMDDNKKKRKASSAMEVRIQCCMRLEG